MNKEPLFRAVAIAGGQTALAKAIGVPQNTLWCWLYRNKEIPAKHAPAIEAVTGVSRFELCPETFGPYQDPPSRHTQPSMGQEAAA